MKRRFRVIFITSAMAAFGLWAGYSAWFFAGDNYRTALRPIDVPAAAWQIVEGKGVQGQTSLELAAPNWRGEVMAVGTLPTPLPGGELERIDVGFIRMGSSASIALGVIHSEGLTRPRDALVQHTRANKVSVAAGDLMLRDQPIRHVSLKIRGAIEPGFVLESAELHRERPDFGTFQALLWRSLVDLSGWSHRSINQSNLAGSPIRVSPVIAVVLWILLTLLVTIPYAAREKRLFSWWLPSIVFSIVVAGWLFLDIGWQISLSSRHLSAIQQFSGKSSSEARLSGIDSDVFRFINDLKEALGDPSQRMLIVGDSVFRRYRARYFAAPHPVLAAGEVRPFWLRRLRSNDSLVLIDRGDALHSERIEGSAGRERMMKRLAFADITGRHAEALPCPENLVALGCEEQILELQEHKGPWLIESPWLRDLGPGLWQLQLDVIGGERSGWARVEVYRRGADGPRQRWSLREFHLPQGRARRVRLSFMIDEAAGFRIRMRPLDDIGMGVVSVRLVPQVAGDDLVKLSVDDSPPYFLAREILDREGHAAWEML